MDCLFCKIYSGDIKADMVYQDDDFMAINDINPQAPIHILIIPKKHLPTINDVTLDDSEIFAKAFILAKKIAADNNIDETGYRLVWNVNSGAGQTVYHIHLHLLGGRVLTWPPG